MIKESEKIKLAKELLKYVSTHRGIISEALKNGGEIRKCIKKNRRRDFLSGVIKIVFEFEEQQKIINSIKLEELDNLLDDI